VRAGPAKSCWELATRSGLGPCRDASWQVAWGRCPFESDSRGSAALSIAHSRGTFATSSAHVETEAPHPGPTQGCERPGKQPHQKWAGSTRKSPSISPSIALMVRVAPTDSRTTPAQILDALTEAARRQGTRGQPRPTPARPPLHHRRPRQPHEPAHPELTAPSARLGPPSAPTPAGSTCSATARADRRSPAIVGRGSSRPSSGRTPLCPPGAHRCHRWRTSPTPYLLRRQPSWTLVDWRRPARNRHARRG
jgi:hypothetical protein